MSDCETIIRNGTVVVGERLGAADLAIDGGAIVALAPGLELVGAEEIDAGGAARPAGRNRRTRPMRCCSSLVIDEAAGTITALETGSANLGDGTGAFAGLRGTFSITNVVTFDLDFNLLESHWTLVGSVLG